MRVLVIGGGGREHALVWKVAQSPKIKKVYCAPGNAGIAELAECVNLKATDIRALAQFAEKERIDLTIVGPEAPLIAGIVDEFETRDLRIFGPSKRAAEIEGSKVFAKELMVKYGVPTGEAKVFSLPEEATDFIKRREPPLVVKADGQAAGKGTFVCFNWEEAAQAVKLIMVERVFGEAGKKVIIEEFLEGEEASIIAFTDGKSIVPLAPSQDHKRVYDGDNGPNTGGMGAYSPVPLITAELFQKIYQEVLVPTIKGMTREGRLYKGVIYAGIMVTKEGAKVLEFNARFGDPETQAVLVRMKSDLVEVVEAVMEGRLERVNLEWKDEAAVCVVLASAGYPGEYEKGKVIRGLEEASRMEDTFIFHSGTERRNGETVTAGGRVLGITALGRTIAEAIERTYLTVNKINFEGMHYRKDIGYRALKKGG